MKQLLQFPTVPRRIGILCQKIFVLGIVLLASILFVEAQVPKVAFVGGTRSSSPDGFSFVAGEAIPDTETIYFTDEEYKSSCTTGGSNGQFHFDGTCSGIGEALLAYTPPVGGLMEGEVVFVSETGTNTFTVTGAGGSIAHSGGNFGIAASDALHAFRSSVPGNPTSNVDEIYSSLVFTNAFDGALGSGDDPSGQHPNAVIIFLNASDGEYDPAKRNLPTDASDIEDVATNWNITASTNLALSTTPFTGGVTLGAAGPTVTFTAPADLCIDAGVQNNLGGGTPTGGTYSGPGVSDDGNGMTYDFDPAAAGVGTHTITYTLTDGTGTGMATDDVEVFALPNVTFTAPADLCVNAGVQAGLGTGTPTGGVYSGTGVTDNGNGMTYSFDPAAAGVGTHTLTYTFTDGNGCTNSASDDVEVLAIPVINSTPDFGAVCANFSSNGFGNFTPTGGTYSGPGVTDDGNGMTFTFDASMAATGNNDIMYTVTVNGCSATSISNFTVNPLPNVTFTAPADLCLDAGVQAGLGGGTPTGGTYSGAGVTDDANGMTYSFDPASAGVGTHTLTYTFTDGNGCTNSATDDVEIFALPTVTMTVTGTGTCITAGVQTGKSGGTPTGGVYSGTGVTDDANGMTYSFDPAAAGAGMHTVTYTFTDANGCTNSASDDETVFPVGAAAFTAPADLCIDAGVQAGLGGGTPTGGIYSGAGVTDDGNGMTYSFNPAVAGVGTTTITYIVGGGACAGLAMDDVEVFALPSVSFTATGTGTCLDAGIQLAQDGGSPSGGVYSGAGVTDDANGMTYSFDPATAGVGLHPIMYSVTDANGCSNMANLNREVFALPNVSFTVTGAGTGSGTCINAGVLTNLSGGNPPDGSVDGDIIMYSGPGVTDNGNGTFDFDPASAGVGVHTLTYTYTDGNSCTNSADDTYEVFPIPVVAFTALADICLNAGVQAGLGGGTPMGGVYSGTGVTDDGNGMTYSFDPAAAGVGTHTITYDYTDPNGCSAGMVIDDDVEVFALPTVTFTALADLCLNDGVQAGLGGGTPLQGTVAGDSGIYSGAGVTDDGNGMTYSFDPAAAGVGTHTLTYTYTDANGCMVSATDDIEVFALPTITFTALADLCVDAGVQAGLGGGTPPQGTVTGDLGVYSGTGVTDDG
ncbi:MAG: beta strand repeat-containing protein, partial [Lewinella sp.]|uniref:beta strand repeat-containing protein n=1 Tax=Lewinella sp. TaxID=2004506 RepID=UPI003D6B88CA